MTQARARRRLLVSWSTGKDAAWSLHRLRQDRAVEVVGLLTTVTEQDPRVAIHETPLAVVRAQARCLGLPLREVPLPWPCPNEVYRERLRDAVETARGRQRVAAVAFGDLFLEDIRAFREELLAGIRVAPLFPLWRKNTRTLAEAMIAGGLEARVVAVDRKAWGNEDRADAALGRPFDRTFLDDLPPGVDPCGENGEFHTLVVGGPGFRRPLAVRFEKGWRQGSMVGLRAELRAGIRGGAQSEDPS